MGRQLAQRSQRDRIPMRFLCGLRALRADGIRPQLVYTEASGNGGVYECFHCALRANFACGLRMLPRRSERTTIGTGQMTGAASQNVPRVSLSEGLIVRVWCPRLDSNQRQAD